VSIAWRGRARSRWLQNCGVERKPRLGRLVSRSAYHHGLGWWQRLSGRAGETPSKLNWPPVSGDDDADLKTRRLLPLKEEVQVRHVYRTIAGARRFQGLRVQPVGQHTGDSPEVGRAWGASGRYGG
jgi:hypothetical protein